MVLSYIGIKPQSMWPKDENQNLTMYTKPLDLRSFLADVEKKTNIVKSMNILIVDGK